MQLRINLNVDDYNVENEDKLRFQHIREMFLLSQGLDSPWFEQCQRHTADSIGEIRSQILREDLEKVHRYVFINHVPYSPL